MRLFNLLLNLQSPLLLLCHFFGFQRRFYLFNRVFFIFQIRLFPCYSEISIFVQEYSFCFLVTLYSYFLFRRMIEFGCHIGQIKDQLSYILVFHFLIVQYHSKSKWFPIIWEFYNFIQIFKTLFSQIVSWVFEIVFWKKEHNI